MAEQMGHNNLAHAISIGSVPSYSLETIEFLPL